MSGRIATGWFIVSSVVLWALWDCFVAWRWGSDATISKVIVDISYDYPIVGVAVGILISSHRWDEMLIDQILLEKAMRQYRRQARELGRQIPLRDDWFSASGDCVCPTCELPYYDHPVCADPAGQIVVLCDGNQAKL